MSKEAIFGILVSVTLALAGWSLKWTFDANAQIQLLNERVNKLNERSQEEDTQNKQLQMLWKYSAWEHWQIDLLRHHDGLEPATQPSLD